MGRGHPLPIIFLIKSACLMFVKEYQLKYNRTNTPQPKINSSKDLFDFLLAHVYDENEINIYENFYILLLNPANKIKGFARISQGGINGTSADPRIIAKYAVETLATAVVLTHNHPSGNTTPSTADRKLTETVTKALQLLEIKVLDHIVMTENNYFSFADNGMI